MHAATEDKDVKLRQLHKECQSPIKYKKTCPVCDREVENDEIVKAYGVWGEKSMYGKKYMGTNRTTFVIDEKGTIVHVITKVDTNHPTDQVLQLL